MIRTDQDRMGWAEEENDDYQTFHNDSGNVGAHLGSPQFGDPSQEQQPHASAAAIYQDDEGGGSRIASRRLQKQWLKELSLTGHGLRGANRKLR